jgi:hypothetical protein
MVAGEVTVSCGDGREETVVDGDLFYCHRATRCASAPMWRSSSSVPKLGIELGEISDIEASTWWNSERLLTGMAKKPVWRGR